MRHISNKCCNTILLRILDKFLDMKNDFYDEESWKLLFLVHKKEHLVTLHGKLLALHLE